MKKVFLALIAIFACFVGFALVETTNAKEEKMGLENKKILIVYYSHSGNTREIANQIKEFSNGDIFEIQTVDEYPSEYRVLTEQAKKEINADYKPALKSKLENVADYDVVFVGSPSWWSTIAPPVATFLTEHDLSNKIIIPFVTHGGSGMGHNAEDIAKLSPNSKVMEGKAFRGSSAKSAQDDVAAWLKGL